MTGPAFAMVGLALLVGASPPPVGDPGAASAAPAAAAPSSSGAPADLSMGALDVRDFGAKGDGRSDDARAIQAALDAAMRRGVRVRRSGDSYADADRLGAAVFFPVGRYMIGSPIVMPRSGPYPAHAVALVGANRESTTIAALPGFPRSRGLVEWERSKRRVVGQKFVSLGFDPNGTDATAVWFQPTAKATYADVDAETMYWMVFRDLVFYSDNSKNASSVRIEGRIDNSTFEDIVQDARLGPKPVYSTVLLHFDDDVFGAGEPARIADYPGFNYGSIRALSQGLRGGRGTLVQGRLSNSRITDVIHGVGALGPAPGIHVRNCGQVIIENAAFEGLAEDGEILVDNCSSVSLRAVSLGLTNEAPGVGLRIVNSRWVHVEGRPTMAGIPPFSANGSRLLSIDRRSRDCRFERIAGTAPFAREVAWGSTGSNGNVIEYFDVVAGTRSVLDENAPPTRR